MNILVKLFPEALVNHLGAYSRLDSLLALPEVSSANGIDLGRSDQADFYRVELVAHGLTLTLQCMNPTAQPGEQTWGLHSMTLNAATWDGDWPPGLNPHKATASDVVAAFAPNPEEVVNMPPMLCFAVEGVASQTWSVMAIFDGSSKKLSSFSLIRVGEWRELEAPRNAAESA